MRRRVRQFIDAPATERRAFVSAIAIVVAVRTALLLLPSGVIVRYVRSLATRPMQVTRIHATPALLMWAVRTASRYVPGASCLTQAVAGLLLLHRNGHSANLCVGIAKTDRGEFRAHAWLERRGTVILGGDVSGFSRMTPFVGSQAGSADA